MVEYTVNAKEFTINSLSVELQMDRRTLADRFRDVAPHRIEGKSKLYTLPQILVALAADFISEGSLDIGEAKARREAALAILAEMDVAERKGETVSTSDVMRAWAQVGTNIKQRLLALPTKAAPLVLGAQTLPEVKAMLDELVREALDELSATPPGAPPPPPPEIEHEQAA